MEQASGVVIGDYCDSDVVVSIVVWWFANRQVSVIKRPRYQSRARARDIGHIGEPVLARVQTNASLRPTDAGRELQ